MPVFFLPPNCITPPHISISGALLTHVRDSLRIHIGDAILVGDDVGRRYRVEVTAVTKQALTGRILDSIAPPVRTTPSLALAQALLKGDKMDWVIQKATELGVQSIHPLQTTLSVVQPKAERIQAQVARWQRIALEAAQQSEQWTVPTVAVPQGILKYWAAACQTLRIILTERLETGSNLEDITLPATREASVLVLVGPEGGWTREEIAEAEQVGFRAVTLGQTILRAETAAIAAIAVLQYRLGGLR